MTERETERLIAWADEMLRVHERLREALALAQETVGAGADSEAAMRDLVLYCRGFCVALDEHHRGEDATLFPAIAAERPELRPALQKLEQDHSMIAHLLDGLRAAVDTNAPSRQVLGHLDGLAAIMESHFRYEERELLGILRTLNLDADPRRVYGPL